MTLKEAIKRLAESGIDSPEYDARELMKHFGKMSSPILTIGTECDNEEFMRAVDRRASREPLQYIIGEVGFYREEYKVTPDCLIPRSDTEILVDYAVKNLSTGAVFADLCSGSGCIGISVLANTIDTRCLSVDISDGALSLTRENSVKNKVSDRLELLKCDLLSEKPVTDGKFSAVLSNPPYIPRNVYQGLEKEIFHEPSIAFVGGEDGLDFYKAIIPTALDMLTDGGFLALEIGYDQAEEICALAEKHGRRAEILKDYSGNDRVAIIKKD